MRVGRAHNARTQCVCRGTLALQPSSAHVTATVRVCVPLSFPPLSPPLVSAVIFAPSLSCMCRVLTVSVRMPNRSQIHAARGTNRPTLCVRARLVGLPLARSSRLSLERRPRVV